MGEIADMMLDGDLCEICGEYLGDGDGYTRRCAGCEDPKPKVIRRAKGHPRQQVTVREQPEKDQKITRDQTRGDVAWLKSLAPVEDNGDHLTAKIKTDRGEKTVDYWLESGKWLVRENKANGVGVKHIVRYFRLGDGTRPAEFV